MLYFVFTTGRCNLRCSYCGGSFNPEIVPWRVEYDLGDLIRLVEGDGDATIAFYGGEPLLNPGFIMEVMDAVPARRFVVQTNGTAVRALPPEYWRRMDAVLLSIDGPEGVTDGYRGRGVYRTVLSSARWLREVGFSGDLIARMTVSEGSDVYRDARHLLELGLFDHVHWQIDAVWSEGWADFRGWAERVYKPGVSRLVDYWISEAREGRVPGLVPVLGVLRVELTGESMGIPPCGAGRDAFAVSTDGRVLACPIAVAEGWAELGRLGSVGPGDLPGRVSIGEPCASCPYLRYCGGRCLYAHVERLWGEEGFEALCDLTRHLVDEVLSVADEVRALIGEGRIDPGEVLYPPYNNTTEIIP